VKRRDNYVPMLVMFVLGCAAGALGDLGQGWAGFSFSVMAIGVMYAFDASRDAGTPTDGR
jgi:hypothetical protein